jgi:bifunctional enzyme CysN/CysC
MVLPAMKRTRIQSITTFDGDLDHAFAPMSIAVTLEDAVDVSRGDLIVHARNVPRAQSAFEAMVIWMGEMPMNPAATYLVKHTTRTTRATIQGVGYRVDVNTLHRMPAAPLQLNEIGRVALQTKQNLFIDPYSRNRATGGFVLVDPVSNDTVAAGMIIDRVPEAALRGRAAIKEYSGRGERGPAGRA